MLADPRLAPDSFAPAALIHADVTRALANLALPNENEAKAVDARQEIDLRIGASFTRLQTLLLQNKFDWGEHTGEGGRLLFRWEGVWGRPEQGCRGCVLATPGNRRASERVRQQVQFSTLLPHMPARPCSARDCNL